jgi:hypothetical protein
MSEADNEMELLSVTNKMPKAPQKWITKLEASGKKFATPEGVYWLSLHIPIHGCE